jgi:hypothetical protein
MIAKKLLADKAIVEPKSQRPNSSDLTNDRFTEAPWKLLQKSQ